jgi:ABC-type glycerol-3-phosphate transport system substrate-binding protein
MALRIRQVSRRQVLKGTLAAVSLAATAGLVQACAPAVPGAAPGGQAPAKEAKIRFLANKLSEVLPAQKIKEQTARFEGQHANIKVELESVAVADYVKKFTVQMAAGDGPDLIEYGGLEFQGFQKQGFLADHSKWIDAEGGSKFLETYEPKFIDLLKANDKIWGLPWWCSTLGLAYNAAWFKAVGLDPDKPPKNWQEFVDYGKKLTRDSDGDGKVDQWGVGLYGMRHEVAVRYLHIWYWGNGASLYNDDMTKSTINTEKGIETFTWYTGLVDQGIVAPTYMTNAMQDIYKDYANQKVNMFTVGPWLRHFVRGSVKELEKELRSAPIPNNGVPVAGMTAPSAFSITSQSKNPDAAWLYLKTMASKENLVEYGLHNDFVPPIKGAASLKEYQGDTWMKVFVEQLATVRLIPAHPRVGDLNMVIADALQSVWLKKKTPKQAADEAAKEMDRILAEK